MQSIDSCGRWLLPGRCKAAGIKPEPCNNFLFQLFNEKKPSLADNTILQHHLQRAKSLLYDRCCFDLRELLVEKGSEEYGACAFRLNGWSVRFRVSKITPAKTGQFVTTWKRGKDGKTQPFDLSDPIDFLIIASQSGNRYGQFIFPKSVLLDRGVITGPRKEGKRGIRVYPPWDIVTSKQAKDTQRWQAKYFVSIEPDNEVNVDLANQLLQNDDTA
ncbi:MAG: hypothetical protein EOO16_15175 [Chitinophagaceae bacterium]|nr:MAG: hypothetical protein EOO16_15175 [Chitinophagaceae bacterium]